VPTATAKVSFRQMIDGTTEDYELLQTEVPEPDTIMDMALGLLRAMDAESPYQVTRYEHSLQTATRAMRDGADEELIVCALLHDIGDMVAPANHSAIAADVLRPYVSDTNYQVVLHHGLFQMYYYAHHYGMDRNARDAYRDQPWYDACVRFCEDWDQTAFDPDYDTEPLETFLPMVRSVFHREPFAHVG